MRALVLLLLTLATARAFHFPGRTHRVPAEQETNKHQVTIPGQEKSLEKRNHSPHHKAEPAEDRLEWQVKDLTRSAIPPFSFRLTLLTFKLSTYSSPTH